MMQNVPGKNRGEIVLYALSTCGWCRKTKEFLNTLGVEYSFVDVDLLDDKEREPVSDEVRRWNPRCSFPTVVINDKVGIVGYAKQEIKEAIGI